LRKLLVGVLAGAVMLAVAAMAFAETQTTYSQKYTTNKAGKSAGTNFDTTSIDPANTEKNNQPKKTRKLVINFPTGTKIDQSVKPYCTKLDESADDPCPKNTQVGSGSAEVRLQFGGDSGVIPAKVTAYNRKSDGNKGLFLYVVPQVSGQAPVVIKPVFKGLKLTTNLTPLCVPPGQPPSCGDLGEAVLTKFHLDTKAYKKGKGKKTKFFIQTPKTCKAAGWKFSADWTYDDASTEHKESIQKCKK
jgi:gas vesicle protein